MSETYIYRCERCGDEVMVSVGLSATLSQLTLHCTCGYPSGCEMDYSGALA